MKHGVNEIGVSLSLILTYYFDDSIPLTKEKMPKMPINLTSSPKRTS